MSVARQIASRRPARRLLRRQLETLSKAGFRKAYFKSGFGEAIVFDDLNPEDETNAGMRVLAGMGLGEPLKL